MKNKIIWVDLDEVLAELLDFVLEKNNYKIWDYKIKREEVKDYYIHRMNWFDISLEEAIDWFRKPMLDDLENCSLKKVDWSYERLFELKENWNKLYVITARIEEYFWDYTKKWIEKYFPNIFEKIIFTDHFTEKHIEKSEIAKQIWIDYMIEDNMDYALELAQNWIKVYLLEKPWNKYRQEKHKNLIRIKSWKEFRI